jgi:hypothetical protein
VVVSPTWANGTDTLARFFFSDPMPISMGSIRTYTEAYVPFQANTLFVLPADEFKEIPREMISTVEVEKTIPYPNGQPGFYFLRLAYAPDAEAVLLKRQQELAAPVQDTVEIDGEMVQSVHTRLDIGELHHAFDGSDDTLIRTATSNPLVVELTFPKPWEMNGVTVRVGVKYWRAK